VNDKKKTQKQLQLFRFLTNNTIPCHWSLPN